MKSNSDDPRSSFGRITFSTVFTCLIWVSVSVSAAPPNFWEERITFRDNGVEKFAPEQFEEKDVQYRCWILPARKGRTSRTVSLSVNCSNPTANTVAKSPQRFIGEFSVSLSGIEVGDVFPLCGVLYKTIRVESQEKPLSGFVEMCRVDPAQWDLPAVMNEGAIVFPLGDFDSVKSQGILGTNLHFGMSPERNEVPRRRAVMRYIAVDQQRRIIDEEQVDEIHLLRDAVFELRKNRYRVVQVVHPKSITGGNVTTRILGWVAISPEPKSTPVTVEPHPWSVPRSFLPIK